MSRSRRLVLASPFAKQIAKHSTAHHTPEPARPARHKPGPTRLTDSYVKKAPLPSSGSWIIPDSEVPGFGLRCTAAGARAFVLNYYTRAGRERRYTIGDATNWNAAAARKLAKEIRRKLPDGYDPLAVIEMERGAKTVGGMCTRFIEDHLPKLRGKTTADYRSMIEREILPAIGKLKLVDVKPDDIDGLHRKISRGHGDHKPRPYLANRVASLLSKMFNLAVHRWQWLSTNPVRGLERNQEAKRERYLVNSELQRLSEALAVHEDRQAADIIRLLLLTGARSRSEVFAMRWADLDLTAGTWTKPASTTKQKKTHTLPLSAPARQLLSDLCESAKPDAEYVFPGRWGGYRTEVRRAWRELCRTAKIKGLRLHDLRHSYASQLVSSGFSLPVIGALLGHSQPATTARYAHLFDEVTRQATERVGAVIAGNAKPSAAVVAHRKPVR
jgi:integrase